MWWHQGYCKPEAAMSPSLMGDSKGAVPAMSLLCARCDGPLSTSTRGLWKDCIGALGVPGAQLITEMGSTVPYRFSFPIITSCLGRGVPLQDTAQTLSLATWSCAHSAPEKGGWK